ncbi:MAG: calmodulin-binding protein [Planctomycetota bacterium]
MRSRIYYATLILGLVAAVSILDTRNADANPRAYGQAWGGTAANVDWNRFYHYPYVYYPQNFWGQEYYRSSDSLYHRYPTEMRIPVYNRQWHNYYPSNRRFHMGHHFILDTF